MAQSGIDIKRVSLLDIVNANQPSQREVVSRITCVAKLIEHMTTEKSKHMKAKHQGLIKRVAESKGNQAANIGGLLLAYPSCCVMQLEAAANNINAVLAAIQEDMPGLFISSMRVVSLTDDIPTRAYREWHFTFAGADVKEHADVVDASLAVKTASDVNLKFLSFAQQLRDLKGQELQDSLEGIMTYWEGMPHADMVLSLLPFTDAPTVQEFLALFDGPVNIDLESERVWPMPKMPQLQS